jgi:hypothetical protein
MKKLTAFIVLATTLLMLSFLAFAQDVAAPASAPVEPAFEFIKQLLSWLVVTFPQYGKVIQGAGELIGGIAALFTLTTVFVQGVLGIPYLIARWAGAHELAEKIKKISDKVTPYFKYLSIFNQQKK